MICFFGRNLDHSHINVVTFVPRETLQKNYNSFHKNIFFCMFGMSSPFGQNSDTFLLNCSLIVVPLKN